MPALIDAAERQRVARAGKVQVGREVDSATATVVQAYARAWQLVRDDLLAGAAEAERVATETGRVDSPAAYRSVRLAQALDKLSVLLGRAGELTGVTVRDAVPPLVRLPADLLRQLGGMVPGPMRLRFDRVSEAELDAIVRRTTQSITSQSRALTDDAQQQLRTSLVRATAAGQGPRQAARELIRATGANVARGGVAEGAVANAREAFAGGMTRAMVLTRTELIDASRVATTATYLSAGDLVQGWVWVATESPRTCRACWAMHGTQHRPDEHQDGHQQCRCTQVPILEGETAADTGVRSREEAFSRMSRTQQEQAVGAKALAHLDAGGSWDDLVRQRNNPGWRSSRVPTPLSALSS